jgi:Carboxylesterase family
MNYRTNLFGFLGALGPLDFNSGLLGQRLSLELVRCNIAVFVRVLGGLHFLGRVLGRAPGIVNIFIA